MRHALVLLPLSALLLHAQVTREGSWWVKTVTGAEAVPENASVVVATRGNVITRGIQDNVVRYSLKVRTRAASAQEAAELLNAYTVVVKRAHQTTGFVVKQGRGTPEIEFKVPRSARQVSVTTYDGSVQLFDLAGTVTASSACGEMKADRIHGDLQMRTSGGDIWVGSVEGSARVFTQGGPIVARYIGGDAVLDTSLGDITVQEVRGLARANTLGGSVRIVRAGAVLATTGGGPVEVGEARGKVDIRSAGGIVQVGGASDVRCENTAGAIRLNNVSGSLRASTSLGSILAQILAGRPLSESFLTTGSGDITVVIPSNVGVRIYALNDVVGSGRRIVSDFPGLTLRQQGSRVIAEGDINGGGPLVRLAGVGGTIFIKRK